MRCAHIRKFEGGIQLLGRERGVHRIDDDILLAGLLDQHRLGIEQIALRLNRHKVFAKRLTIRHTLLV